MNTKIFFLSFLMFFLFQNSVFGQTEYRLLVKEGNVKFKGKDYDGASSKFSEAVKVNGEDFAAHYNLGNAYMKLDDAEKAADAYKGSLKQKPYSEPTRKNYEIAMLKLKKEHRDKDQSSSSGKSGGGDDQNKGKDGDSKDKNQSQGKGQQNEGEGKNPEDAKKGNTESRLSKENEKRLLDHIGEKEKQTARRILNDNSYSMPESNEKDW